MRTPREPKVVVTTSLPRETWEALDKLRKETGRTICDLLRTAALEYVAK